MTIEGAIVDLQNLIDDEGIPFWAKPSLQKVKETVEDWARPCSEKVMGTVEAEREKHIALQEQDKAYVPCYLGSPCEYQNPEVKIPVGKWIEKDGWDGDVYYDCSVCGESWTTIEGTPWDNDMNYCPHCGAKMEGAEE